MTQNMDGPKHHPPLCHPDRNPDFLLREIWGKWRDLQFSQLASDSNRSTAIPFVIRVDLSEAWKDPDSR